MSCYGWDTPSQPFPFVRRLSYVYLGTLAKGLLAHTIGVVTFAPWGFANFSSIVIQMAVTSNLAPNQRPLIVRFGLRLFFLPPYCPHLNRIETLWRLVKHHWLTPSAYTTFATLREHVTAILNVVGLNYRVSFS